MTWNLSFYDAITGLGCRSHDCQNTLFTCVEDTEKPNGQEQRDTQRKNSAWVTEQPRTAKNCKFNFFLFAKKWLNWALATQVAKIQPPGCRGDDIAKKYKIDTENPISFLPSRWPRQQKLSRLGRRGGDRRYMYVLQIYETIFHFHFFVLNQMFAKKAAWVAEAAAKLRQGNQNTKTSTHI